MNSFLFVSSFLLGCFTSDGSFATNQFVGLSLAIKKLYHSECILFVHCQTFASVYRSTEVTKSLSKYGVVAGSVNAQNLNKTATNIKCQGNKPIFVWLGVTGNQEFSLFTTKLPSYARWLVFLDTSQTTSEFFKHVHVPFNCEVLVAQSVGLEIKLTEVYQVAEGFPLNERPFGNWGQQTGLNTTTLALYERRNDLEGVVIKAVCMEFAPESVMIRDSNQNIEVDGLYGMVWSLLQSRLNFKTNVTNSTDKYGEFGALVNGTWHGLVANVHAGKADVVLNAITYQNERMDVVKFLSPITHSRVNLIVRKPSGVSFQWTSFLSPFDPSLWLVVIVSILLSGGLLATSYRLESRARTEPKGDDDEFQLGSAIFHVFGLYCTQGCPFEPRAVSGRTVLLLAGLTSTVLVAAYSGALTSFITVQKLDLPYETIQEYVQDNDYQLEMSPSAFWLYLMNPRNDLYRVLYDRMITGVDDMPSDWYEGVKKMCQSKRPYGLIAQYHFVDRLVRDNNCDFVAVPSPLLVDTESFIVSKEMPYAELFNRNLQHMRVSGVLHHIHQLAWPAPLAKLDVPLPIVHLYQVVPIIAVLAAGMAVSVLIIMAEKKLR